MKKIISLALATVLIIGCCLGLASCGGGSGAPDGMKLVRGSDALGYYFYAPEEWTVSNHGDISAVYVSAIDTTSVTFVKSEMPEILTEETELAAITRYFGEEIASLSAALEPSVVSGITECNFGKEDAKADRAYEAAYTVNYDSGNNDENGNSVKVKIGIWQIFVIKGDEFFIFTFSSSKQLESSQEKSRYDRHLESVKKIVSEFKFVEKSGEEDPKKEYPTVDGYMLISDRVHTGFDFYVPLGYTPDFPTDDSQFVSASRDGITVSMGRAERPTSTPMADEYFKDQVDRIAAIAEITAEPTTSAKIHIKDNVLSEFTEYSFKYNGVEYKVYQVLAREATNQYTETYLFTYTARTDLYDANLAEAKDILARVEY